MGVSLFPAALLPIAKTEAGYLRWSETLGWIPTFEAQSFEVAGFEGASFFTCVVHIDGWVGFGAFDAQTGCSVEEYPHLTRPITVEEARRVLRREGREAYEVRVAQVLAEREANRG